jgi:hypothetical protein
LEENFSEPVSRSLLTGSAHPQYYIAGDVQMKPCPPELARRLLYIIHLGFVEARLLALGERHQQLFDLADALENFSSYIDTWEENYIDMIRFNLKIYQEKYPGGTFDFLAKLERDQVPNRF